MTVPFAYSRPRAAPPAVADWFPRAAAASTPLALTLRLADVPDPDPAIAAPGAPAGAAGGGWLPGVSVAVADPAGRPRPVAARLLWTDGAGGASVAVTADASGDGSGWGGRWDEAGSWNVTVAMALDSGGVGATTVPVAVLAIAPPQAR